MNPKAAPGIDIGIAEADRLTITDGISRLLADTYTLYLKTHNYHWNVTGPQFNTLHLMFETQYNELWTAVDLLAERIRALGVFVPGSNRQFAALTVIPEAEGVPSAEEMLADLVAGHEAVRAPLATCSPLSSRPATKPPPTCSPSVCRSTKRRHGCSDRCSASPRLGVGWQPQVA